jgi:hypothetical protein
MKNLAVLVTAPVLGLLLMTQPFAANTSSSSATNDQGPSSGPSSFGPESHTTPGAGPEPH